MGMSPFSADESLEITISLSINDSKCDDFMAEAGANICTATTPHLLTSGNEVVDVSTAGQDVSDETVYQEDSPLLSGDYGTICADSPMHGDCDYDKDGVSNRLDPCVEEPEEFSSDGKTPLDGINDGCPESSGQTGGGGSQKYGSGGNPYNQNPAGTGYYPSDNFSSGEGACTLIENSRMTFASVLFVLIPIIALILGYAGVPARARRRGRNKQKSGGRRYYN